MLHRCIPLLCYIPAICWCKITPFKLYKTNVKVLKHVLYDGTYKKLVKKVRKTFLVSILYEINCFN